MRSMLTVMTVALLSFLLVVPALAQTEEELIAKYLEKTEKKHQTKVGFIVLQGSYGLLSEDSDYNKFAQGISPWISGDVTAVPVEGIYRSKEFHAGFGLMTTPKIAATIGFSYWLQMGSSTTGDFSLSLVNHDSPSGTQEDFALRSEVQVYGFSGSLDYYLLNAPTPEGQLNGLAFKVQGNIGYYFANWELWDGFAATNLYLSQTDELAGKLTGSAPGFALGLAAEYPIGLFGLVVEGGARYQYLNFSKMKWYNDLNHENVVTVPDTGERVELDFSGIRGQFGLKRYFNW